MTDERRAQLNEYQRENRKYRKLLQRCIICGKRDAYTLGGRSSCYECCEKAHGQKLSAEALENRHLYQKRLYDERRAQGICVSCGKKAEKGKSRCAICLAKDRRSVLKRDREKGALPSYLRNGIDYCASCTKPLTDENRVHGKKLCKTCYDKACKSLEIARSYINLRENAHYFEQQAFWNCRESKTKEGENERLNSDQS